MLASVSHALFMLLTTVKVCPVIRHWMSLKHHCMVLNVVIYSYRHGIAEVVPDFYFKITYCNKFS